jgi:MtfA peptidase
MLRAAWQAWRVQRYRRAVKAAVQRRPVQEAVWQSTCQSLPFVMALPAADRDRLRVLVSLFLDSKEFSGAHDWQVTDAQAVMVGTQACLPVLYIAPADRPDLALAWYDGFVGIVLHASQVRARREWVDDAGVSHSGSEDLTGEVLEGGPLMLAWSDVATAGQSAEQAYNVVIHEFIHVMDMRSGVADACPPMPEAQRSPWLATIDLHYNQFCEQVAQWERFGTLAQLPEPWIDAYGSTSIEEFFAVACEAYFVQRPRFAAEYPALFALFETFFRRY